MQIIDRVTQSRFENDAVSVFYEEEGAGETVLVLPGLFGSIAEMTALRKALVSAGFYVLAADLPGSGRSLPQPRDFDVDYYQEDADTMLELLRHKQLTPAHIMGFSDGGEVALLMAIESPESIRSVLTWGAVGVMSDPDGFLRQALRTIVDAPLPMLMGLHDYILEAYSEDVARVTTENVAHAFDQIVARGGDISASRASEITCPTLLIAGSNDFIASPSLVSDLAGKIPGSQAITLEGSGHAIHEENPDWLVTEAINWLKQQA